MTRFGISDLRLSDKWQRVAHQDESLYWDWVLDAAAYATLLAAREHGRAITAQRRDPATSRMVLLAKLAGT